MLLLCLLSCATGGKEELPPDDSGVDSGDPEVSLPDCTAASGDADRIALSGVVLLPEGAVGGSVVYQPSTGKILCAGKDCDTSGATVICTEGIISPGLIDPHNHMQYNSLPPWQVPPEFENRYEWQRDDRYDDYRTAFDAISDSSTCEIMKWAEARELMHGATASMGSSGGSCVHLLVRNLDEGSDEHGFADYDIIYNSSNVSDRLEQADADEQNADLASGALDALVYHVAEGKNATVQDEIDYMFELGMVGPGQVYVHASDASTEQLAEMASQGTGVIWSPRSNLALYATTTPISIAHTLGVPWALGTDWTPSGSMGPLEELACAQDWLEDKGSPISAEDLWAKSTADAARLLNLDGVVGSLQDGLYADITVFEYGEKPWEKLFSAEPQDVKLVIVNGRALYGRSAWIDSLAENVSWCEDVDVCGESQKICLKAAESGDDAQTLEEVEQVLAGGMANVTMPAGYEYAKELYPLFECAPPPTCSLAEPSAGDDDGDGVADSGDLCPGVYNPEQWDTDGDGEGDDCDPCPTVADSTDCPISAGDRDGDGIPDASDNCSQVGNADQADADGDAKGDACDPCPQEPNPGDTGCSATVPDIQDEANLRYGDGDRVKLSGLLVTAVGEDGFYAQDPDLTEHAGLYVYDPGGSFPSPGDLVEVNGTVKDYYGLAELTGATYTVTGSGDVPAPITGSTCDFATGGAQAEVHESMLVQVVDVEVTDDNADDDPDGSGSPDYGSFVVDSCLWVDDTLGAYAEQPARGTRYSSLTGVLTFSFDNHKLAPRIAEDLLP